MTGRTAVLSTAEREQGFASYMKHITWNGLGVFLLNNTVVSLMAIHFGASNLELGYINAAFHVTGVVSLLVPRIFRGRRITGVFGWAWMARGITALFYGLLLLLSGPVARFTILLVFTGFCIARAVGVSVAHAVQRDVMRDREVGGSIVRLNIRLGYAQFAAQLLSFGLLSLAFLQGITGLVTIAYIGIVMNTVASIHILRIPGRSVVEDTTGTGALATAVKIFRHRHQAIPLLVHCLGMGVYVLFAFQVVFLRRVLEAPDSMAILFTLVGAVAAILANIGLKPFADSIGEKPLLVIASSGLAVSALAWAFIPGTLTLPVYFLLGFVTYFFVRSLLTLKSAALVKAIPQRNRIAYTSTANVTLGVVALVLGLAGGALADLALLVPRFVVHQYTFTFLFTAMIAGLTTVLCLKLPGGRSLSLRETADIMLSVRNLRAFLDANQLDFAGDPAQRESLLLSLERSSTAIATSRLRERLRGPSVAEKERVLRILFRSPRTEILEEIIEQARDPAGYNRRDALFTLGAYRDERAKQALRETLREGCGPETEAVALKSLARQDCRDLLPEIRERLKDGTGPPRAELDLAVAEAVLDPEGPQLEVLFERAFARGSVSFATTRLLISFNRLDLKPGLQGYLQAEMNFPGRGFMDLLEEAGQFEVILTARSRLKELVDGGEFTELWNTITEMLQSVVLSAPEEMPRRIAAPARSVVATGVPPDPVARVGTLAALYVLFHVLDAAADR